MSGQVSRGSAGEYQADSSLGIHIVNIKDKIVLLGSPGLQEIFKVLLFEGPEPDRLCYFRIFSR